jgi:hypothetical protein
MAGMSVVRAVVEGGTCSAGGAAISKSSLGKVTGIGTALSSRKRQSQRLLLYVKRPEDWLRRTL